ncbi:MAG: ATP-dependent Clp protease proteolytic subunit [Candidatus Buchananbacteria bacterium]
MSRKKTIACNFTAEDSYALEGLHNHCIHVPSRQIWIHGTPLDLIDPSVAGVEPGVEYMMSTRLEKNLELLRWTSEREPVIIHLHTNGGMVEEGIAIYDMIKSMPFRVIMINHTHARSMSSVILQAADVRFMLPHSHFMFHGGSIGIEAEMRTAYSNIKFCQEFFDKFMLDVYTENATHGKKFRDKKVWTKAAIRAFLEKEMEKKADVFLTAKETVDWGFADEIMTSWDQIKAAKTAV